MTHLDEACRELMAVAKKLLEFEVVIRVHETGIVTITLCVSGRKAVADLLPGAKHPLPSEALRRIQEKK